MCVCVIEYVHVAGVPPVMCGGQFSQWTLQVLLEAEVEGLADGADDFLGQPVRTLQDVTC